VARNFFFVEFCENLVSGTTFDPCVKARIMNIMSLLGIEAQVGICETLAKTSKAMLVSEAADADKPRHDGRERRLRGTLAMSDGLTTIHIITKTISKGNYAN
jgi:hypothetical protein